MPLGIWAGPNGDQSCFGPSRRPAPQGGTGGNAAPAKSAQSGKIAAAAKKLDTTWGDNNITSSTITVGSGTFKGAAVTRDALTSLADEQLRSNAGGRGKFANMKTEVGGTVKATLTEAARTVNDKGFDYSPENRSDRAAVSRGLTSLVATLGDPSDVRVACAKSGAHTAYVFANAKTKDFVTVYVKAGSF